MKRIFAAASLMLALSLASPAQTVRPERPLVKGIAHAAFWTDDMKNTEQFFTDYLGYAAPYYVDIPGQPRIMLVKINDRQYVEFFEDSENRLVKYRHTAFETDDVEAMRQYLRVAGVPVPDECTDTGLGFKAFFCKDFNGHDVEFVEYTGKGTIARHYGKDMPSTAISDVMRHVGWVCQDSARDLAFYGYILGFTETWRGGRDPARTTWIKMRVPDGEDCIELMLTDHNLNRKELGSSNHIDLDLDDVKAAKSLLDTRKLPEGCRPAGNPGRGVSGFGQTSMYLKDDTRVEIMTSVPLDGKPSDPTYGLPLRYDGVQDN